jgi:hypothetical protein
MRPALQRAVATGIGLTALAAACGGDARTEERLAELRSERRSLLVQFSATQNAIRRLQGRALDEPGVAALQDSFYVALRRHVEETDPEGAELMARAQEVGEDLKLFSEPVLLAPGDDDPRPSDEERRDVVAELAEVERALRPVIDRAMADPVVSARFRVLKDSLVAAMVRMEPAARNSLDLMAEIQEKIAAIDEEMGGLTD